MRGSFFVLWIHEIMSRHIICFMMGIVKTGDNLSIGELRDLLIVEKKFFNRQSVKNLIILYIVTFFVSSNFCYYFMINQVYREISVTVNVRSFSY